METETALTPAVITGREILAGAMVADDTLLWSAWQMARERWLASKRNQNTVRAYELAARQFYEWAACEPWRVSPVHAQDWKQHLARTLAPATVGLKLAAMSNFYWFVQNRHVVPIPPNQDIQSIHDHPFLYITPDGHNLTLWPADRANPFSTVDRPAVPDNRAKFPTTVEFMQLIAEINTTCLSGKRDFALLYAFATTGRRFNELINLRWGDIDADPRDDGDYTYTYQVLKKRAEGETRRAVLDANVRQAIVSYLEADGRPIEGLAPGAYIFVPIYPDRIRRIRPDAACDPNRPISNSTANAILKKYAKRANVDPDKCHVHGLRHTAARMRVEHQREARGAVDTLQLQQFLGHANLNTTQHYIQSVHTEPTDPDVNAISEKILKTALNRRKRKPAAEQERLL
jgi:integrase